MANLLLYNVLGGGGSEGEGANLYGVEDSGFYARNLLLNLNLVALLGLGSGPLLALLLPLLPRILRLLCRTVAHEVNLGVALALNEDGGDPAKVATPLLHKLIQAFPEPPQQSLRPIRSMK